MTRKSKTDQELGYLKMFWEELRTLEVEYSGAVTMFVSASRRIGVMEYRLVFTSLLDDETASEHTCTYKFDYPNAGNTILAGQLWNASRILADLVGDVQVRNATRKTNGG